MNAATVRARTAVVGVPLALILSACGNNGSGTPTAGNPTTAASTPAPSSAGETSACDGIADAVHALVSGTADHTDKTVGGFELCKWDSTEATTTGMHAFFQVTLAGGNAFDALSKGLDQSTQYMTGVKKLTPAGFDQATGFWNEPTHTAMLLVRSGDHAVLLEGSLAHAPSTDALVTIAHTLLG